MSEPFTVQEAPASYQVILDTPRVRQGYKQTEVGVIPEDWDVKRLGDVLHVRHGKSQHHIVANNGQYPILATGGEIGRTNAYLYDKPSVLIGRKGTIDKPRYQDTPFWTVDTLFYTELSNAANPKFIYFKFQMIDWRSYNEASGVPSLNASTIENIEISIPDYVEQRAIATALSDVDALLAAQDKLIAKKRDIKQAAMQQLLTGKQRLPGFTGEWEVRRLEDICWYQEGPGVRNYQFTKQGVKLLNGTNIVNGRVALDTTNRYISEEEAFGSYRHFLVDDGDILIASSGVTIDKFHEKVAFASSEHLPLCMNTSTIRFKPNSAELLDKYLYFFLQSDLFKEPIGKQATGSAQLNFGPAHLKKINLSLPPTLAEQAAITNILADMDADLTALEQQRDKTHALKQGMMQELLTGKIRLISANA